MSVSGNPDYPMWSEPSNNVQFIFTDLLHITHIYHLHQLGDKTIYTVERSTRWNTFTGTYDVVTELYSVLFRCVCMSRQMSPVL